MPDSISQRIGQDFTSRSRDFLQREFLKIYRERFAIPLPQNPVNDISKRCIINGCLSGSRYLYEISAHGRHAEHSPEFIMQSRNIRMVACAIDQVTTAAVKQVIGSGIAGLQRGE